MAKPLRTFIIILLLVFVAGVIALPSRWTVDQTILGRRINFTLAAPVIDFQVGNRRIYKTFELKQGLDLRGGMQVVLQADMAQIPAEERQNALESVREVILRRVDLYGINEPVVQTSQQGETYRILVELAGVEDPNQALQLVGTTANLDFRLQATPTAQATDSATSMAMYNSFQTVGLTGGSLKRTSVQFEPQTNQPVVSLEFNEEGTKLFADLTSKHTGKLLGIFIDDYPIMAPVIQDPILTGQAMIQGGFTVDQARQLSIQLNAGVLPVPVNVIEQRVIGASLGQQSIQDSIRAGLVGLSLVMIFMIMMYGFKGFLADIALVVYAVFTIAIYKLLGVTLTLPGVAGLLLSVGMAVDANILIFERMKEELRSGRSFVQAMELGFGRAWDSIKDANLATIATALILINPLNLGFLNTSGLVRGFGVTLLIGVLISLFTGVFVTRTLMRLFLKGQE